MVSYNRESHEEPRKADWHSWACSPRRRPQTGWLPQQLVHWAELQQSFLKAFRVLLRRLNSHFNLKESTYRISLKIGVVSRTFILGFFLFYFFILCVFRPDWNLTALKWGQQLEKSNQDFQSLGVRTLSDDRWWCWTRGLQAFIQLLQLASVQHNWGPLPQSLAGASHLLRRKNSNIINVFCEGRCQRNKIPLYENSKDSGKGVNVYEGG